MINILITSPIQNVGKSTLALLTTFALLDRKKSVHLIDADMGRYTIAERLGFKEMVKEEPGGKYYEVNNVNTLGYKFWFSYCDMSGAVVGKDEVDYCVIDFDVTRSAAHGDYYFPRADVLVIPQPPWTIDKNKDWTMRFLGGIQDQVKGRGVIIPTAMARQYERKTDFEAIKWTNPEIYAAWKKYKVKATPVDGEAIEYNEDWEKYINFKPYGQKEVKQWISRTEKPLLNLMFPQK